MTELCLGIVTNLALSRSFYYYYFKRNEASTQNVSQPGQRYACGSRSRSGYSQHPDTSIPRFSQTGTAGKRDLSTARSEASDIPLKPIQGIEKTTEIEMRIS
jgi:hypothetical protein